MMPRVPLPDSVGVMLLPECTLFPNGVLPLRIFEPQYRHLLEDALRGDSLIAVVCRDQEETGLHELDAAPVGTIGLIRACVREPDGSAQLILHGLQRIEFTQWERHPAYPHAQIRAFQDLDASQDHHLALLQLKQAVLTFAKHLPVEIQKLIESFTEQDLEPNDFCDLICQHFIQSPKKRQQILEMPSIQARLHHTLRWIRDYGKPSS